MPGFSIRNEASKAACAFVFEAAFAFVMFASTATSSADLVSGVKPPAIGAAKPAKKLTEGVFAGRLGITIGVALPLAMSKPEKAHTVWRFELWKCVNRIRFEVPQYFNTICA